MAQGLESLVLLTAEMARLAVDHAECTDRVAVGHRERRAGIEADVEILGDQRIVGEPAVVRGVLHDEDLVVEDGMGAEGDVAQRRGRPST